MYNPLVTSLILMVIYVIVTFLSHKNHYSTVKSIIIIGVTYNLLGVYAFANGDEKTATACCLSSIVIMSLKKITGSFN